MPAGRPTDYRPEFCEQVVEHCRDGRSLASFCNEIGIARQTLYQWRARFSLFNDACSRALIAAQTWFEERCRNGLEDRNFNSRLAEFLMAAQFRDDYAPQTQRIELTGANGTPLNQRSLTRDELLALAAPILEAEVVEEKLKQLPEPPAQNDNPS